MELGAQAAAPGKTLIAGVGAESVRETVAMANRAAEIGYHVGTGADAVLLPRPDAPSRNAGGILPCRRRPARRFPFCIYNIPQVTGYDLPVETIAELSHHPNIVGMKDSSGNMREDARDRAAVKPGFQISPGSRRDVLRCALRLARAGAILAIANADAVCLRDSLGSLPHAPR